MVFSENSYYRSTRRNLALLNVIEKVSSPFVSPVHMFEDDGVVVYRFPWINTLPCWVMAIKVCVFSYAHFIVFSGSF